MALSGMKLTAAGANMMALTMAGKTLTFTRGAFGDANNRDVQPNIDQLKSLANEKLSLPIVDVVVTENRARVDCLADNSNVAQGFRIAEIGLFAKIDDGEEQLYSYHFAGSLGDWMPETDGSIAKDYIYTLVTQISNASVVTAVIQKTAAAEMPTASSMTKGGVKVGSGLKMDGETLMYDPACPFIFTKRITFTNVVSAASLGAGYLELDNAKVTFSEGLLEAPDSEFVLDGANIGLAGAVIDLNDATIQGSPTFTEGLPSSETYILPTASATQKGGVKVGNGLSMTGDTLNVTLTSNDSYTLPTASATQKGGIKVGFGLGMNQDSLEFDTSCEFYFKKEITMDKVDIGTVKASSINAVNSDIDLTHANVDITSAAFEAARFSLVAYDASLDAHNSHIDFSGSDFDVHSASLDAHNSHIDFSGSDFEFHLATVDAHNAVINLNAASLEGHDARINFSDSDLSLRNAAIDAHAFAVRANDSRISVRGASIDASSALISLEKTRPASLTGYFQFGSEKKDDDWVQNATIDAQDQMVLFVGANIAVDESKIEADKASIRGVNATVAGDVIFTGTPFFQNGISLSGSSSLPLPTASSTVKGGIKVGNGLSMTGDTLNVTLTASETYTLPTASSTIKGGIKVGNGLAMSGDTLNVTLTAGETYTLPTASSTIKGGIKVGNGLSMTGDTLNVTLSSAVILDTVPSTVEGAMWYVLP